MTSTVFPVSTSRCKTSDQPVHIRHMKSRRGLIENINRSAGRAAGELRCKLHALRLAAGERCRALAELHITKTDINERLHLLADLRKVFKEREAPRRSCREPLRYFAFGPQAFHGYSGCHGRPRRERHRPKVHFDLDQTVSAAGLTAAAPWC